MLSPHFPILFVKCHLFCVSRKWPWLFYALLLAVKLFHSFTYWAHLLKRVCALGAALCIWAERPRFCLCPLGTVDVRACDVVESQIWMFLYFCLDTLVWSLSWNRRLKHIVPENLFLLAFPKPQILCWRLGVGIQSLEGEKGIGQKGNDLFLPSLCVTDEMLWSNSSECC